jgi:hypothetical protein
MSKMPELSWQEQQRAQPDNAAWPWSYIQLSSIEVQMAPLGPGRAVLAKMAPEETRDV